MDKIRIQVPAYVNEILNAIHVGGHEAYIVGGCVRDALLGRTPGDYDITTSARPEEIQALFKRTVPTGIKHGTVTVLAGKEKCEVTTYRIDGKYADGRHPESVTFTASLEEDLKRRDFTINAFAWSEEEGLIDYFNGLEDLKNKIVRAVGEPTERFSEDALRILRAFRFSAQLGFEIELSTLQAAKELAGTLEKISAERIHDELIKLISSDHPEKMLDLYEAGITSVILPEFDALMHTPQQNPWHCYDAGTHSIKSMCAVRNDPVLRLTMLLHDIAKSVTRHRDDKGIDHFYGHPAKGAVMAEKILRRLKCDNKTIRRVTAFIRYHDFHVGTSPDAVRIRMVMHMLGREDFPLLLEVVDADNAAKAPDKTAGKEKEQERMLAMYHQVLESGDPIDLQDLAVTGADLLEHGIPEGRMIGILLEAMMQDVLTTPAHNTKEYLLAEGTLEMYLHYREDA